MPADVSVRPQGRRKGGHPVARKGPVPKGSSRNRPAGHRFTPAGRHSVPARHRPAPAARRAKSGEQGAEGYTGQKAGTPGPTVRTEDSGQIGQGGYADCHTRGTGTKRTQRQRSTEQNGTCGRRHTQTTYARKSRGRLRVRGLPCGGSDSAESVGITSLPPPSWRRPPWRSSERPDRRCRPASFSRPKR